MTDLQDAICDQLAGNYVGRHWTDGPLALAARAIRPEPEPGLGGYRKAEQELAKIIGWPSALCAAIQSAVSAFEDEEDRRALAIALFSQIKPHVRKRLSVKEQCSINADLWLQSHLWVCSEQCDYYQHVARLVEVHESGQKVPYDPGGDHLVCEQEWENRGRPPTEQTLATRWSMTAGGMLIYALSHPKGPHHRSDSLYSIVASVATIGGVENAIAICHELAWRFRLCGKPLQLWSERGAPL